MKKILRFLILILLVVLVVGCAKDRTEHNDDFPNDNPPVDNTPASDGERANLSNLAPQENRKVIYKARISLISTNPSEAYENITDKLTDYDAYVESLEISTDIIKATLRVKTDNLTDFISHIQTQGETVSYVLNSEDITNTYITYQARLIALQTQHTRLLELYEEATDTKTRTEIVEQLLDVEAEMEQIELKLNQYDSLVEYSTINLTITKVDNLNAILPQTEAPSIADYTTTSNSATIIISNKHDKIIEVKVTLLLDGKKVDEISKTIYQYDQGEFEFKDLKPGTTYRIEATAQANDERPSYKTYLTIITESRYISTVGKVFIGSLNAFVEVLKFLLLAIIAILPFGAAGTGIGFGIRAIYKKKKLKKQIKQIQNNTIMP